MTFRIPDDLPHPSSGLGDRIEQHIRKLGLNSPSKPSGQIPDLPTDLTNVTAQEVGRLLAEYNAWLAYLIPLAARAKIDAKEAKINLSTAKVLKHPAQKRIDLEHALVEREAYADAFEALERSVSRRRDAASREITRLIGVQDPGDERR